MTSNIKKIGEIEWKHESKWHFGYICEVIKDSDDVKIVRYFTDVLLMANGIPYMTPLLRLKKTIKGKWRVYFLEDSDSDEVIFERKGYEVRFYGECFK